MEMARKGSTLTDNLAKAACVAVRSATSLEERRQSAHIDKLGSEGFAGKICGLTGALAKFNGLLCHPTQVFSTQVKGTTTTNWDAKVTTRTGAGVKEVVILTLPRKHFELILDLECATRSVVGVRNQQCGSNRSSVRLILDATCAQFRGAMRKKGKPVADIFREIDIDGSGFIEQDELIEACRRINVHLNPDDIDLVRGSQCLYPLRSRFCPSAVDAFVRRGWRRTDFDRRIRQIHVRQ